MATYFPAPVHERLHVFFGEFFRAMRKAPPQAYGQFLLRAEQEFNNLGYREKISSGVENILIVRFDAIGDMILTSGFIREVRRNFPQVRITLLCFSDVKPVVELCPYVNEVLSVDRNLFNNNFVEVMERIAVFCRENLWQKKFSIAFSPRWHSDTFMHLMMAWLSGARERIGYGSYPFDSWQGAPPANVVALDNFLLTKKIVTPKEIVRDVDKNYYLLLAADFDVNQTNIELFYSAAEVKRAKDFLEVLPSDCKKVVLGIGAKELRKKYPVEKYLIALRELAKKNLAFVIVGGQNKIAEADFLEKNLPSQKVLNLAGKTTLIETEAVIAQTDYYLGNDTGVLHMAAAARLPVLALYRETIEKDTVLDGTNNGFLRFPPYQTKSIVLRPEHSLGECATLPPVYGGCHYNAPHCIAQITPQEIVAGFEKLQTL